MYLILGLGFISFICSLLLTPLVRDIFLRWNLVDHPDGVRKRHKQPIPRVGGISIAVAYLAAFGLALLIPFSYSTEIARALPTVWKFFLAAGIVFATGLLDDLIGLSPWQKLAGQFSAAAIAYWAGVQVHVVSGHALGWLNIPISFIWLIGCTNAFNLIDGLDGLAAGVGLFATITMLFAGLTGHNLSLALVTMPLAGCLLGFLRYNFNPASIFLGDCGSLLIGFLLGCYGALWSQKSATLLGMTAPMMAMSIPLLDAGLSIVRRFLRHQPIFGADRGHIHHKLLNRGMTPRRVALLMYGVCGLAATLSLVQNALHNEFAGLNMILFCLASWIGIQHLGYVEFTTARQLLFQGTFRRIIDAQTRLQEFEKELTQAVTVDECWTIILNGSRDFGFQSLRLYVRGRLYEQELTERNDNACWQLRIPLPDSQYVNFHRNLSAEISPMAMGTFVNTVERALSAKLLNREPELISVTVDSLPYGSPEPARATSVAS